MNIEDCGFQIDPVVLAEIKRMRAALEQIVEEDWDACGCLCDDENCCVVVGEYCAPCIARQALRG